VIGERTAVHPWQMLCAGLHHAGIDIDHCHTHDTVPAQNFSHGRALGTTQNQYSGWRGDHGTNWMNQCLVIDVFVSRRRLPLPIQHECTMVIGRLYNEQFLIRRHFGSKHASDSAKIYLCGTEMLRYPHDRLFLLWYLYLTGVAYAAL